MLKFDKPYSIRTSKRKYSRWFGNYYVHEIIFEDTVILSSTSYDELYPIMGALNGAYNLGKWDNEARKDY